MMRNLDKVFVAMVVGVALIGCGAMRGEKGQTWPFQVGPDVPAAEGHVVVTPTDEGNQKLKVEVRHLAQPEAVKEGATTYVVWLRPEGQERPINLGALAIDKDLKGTLETRTAYNEFDLFVTAEKDAAIAEPSDRNRVMRASVVVPERAVR